MRLYIKIFLIIFMSNYLMADKYALVIGNSSYKKDALKNPVNDAVAIAKKLKLLDFDVDLNVNADFNDMSKLITKFSEKVTKKDILIFFYAGHAVQYNGGNYLLPIGIMPLKKSKELLTKAISLRFILESFSKKSKLKIVILDACRTSPFAQFHEDIKGGLSRNISINIDNDLDLIDETFNKFLEGTLIAYSTSPDKIANDGDGEHSPYTKYLLQNITKSNFTIEDILKNTRADVTEETSGFQTPWYESSINGKFYPAGTDYIEFIDLLKIYAPNKNTDYNAGDWKSGASEFSPIKWKHKGLKWGKKGATRTGTVAIKNSGEFSHTILNQKDSPVKWDIKLSGSKAGFDVVSISNNVSTYPDNKNNGKLKIPKKYIVNSKVLCLDDEFVSSETLIKIEKIKLDKKRPIWLLSHQYCGGASTMCSYQYKLYLDKKPNFYKEPIVKECVGDKQIAKEIKNNNMTILPAGEDGDGDVAEVIIEGNGERCKVAMTPPQDVVSTNCIRLTNSKKIKIVCTKRKKICKTEAEVFKFMQENHGK